MVQLQKARLALTKAMQDLNKQLGAVENAIKSHPDKQGGRQLGSASTKLRTSLKDANKRLADSLDKALSESDAAKRTKLYDIARRTSQDLVKVLEDRLSKGLEHNPLDVPVSARPQAVKALVELNRALS
jgi:DNA anti-recombination protein RmuC